MTWLKSKFCELKVDLLGLKTIQKWLGLSKLKKLKDDGQTQEYWDTMRQLIELFDPEAVASDFSIILDISSFLFKIQNETKIFILHNSAIIFFSCLVLILFHAQHQQLQQQQDLSTLKHYINNNSWD